MVAFFTFDDFKRVIILAREIDDQNSMQKRRKIIQQSHFYNNFIYSKQMLQFTPMEFSIPLNSLVTESSPVEGSSNNHQDQPISDQSNDTLSDRATVNSRQNNTTISQEHNMIKHIITMMKQLVGIHIVDIGNHYTKPIILQAWKVFERCKKPSRKILKAMFDKRPDKGFIQQYGFKAILNQYGLQKFQQAMEDIRNEVMFRMRRQNIKKHLMGREIQRKQRLAAYSQYLIEYEIKKGEILLRANDKSKKRISQILRMNSQEKQYIDFCLFSASQYQQGFQWFIPQQSNH